jgi:hypothetical protein
MDWWRAYHGLPNDPKIALVALVTPCNAKKHEVTAVWVTLLDLASQNTPRGSIDGADSEQIGWTLEMEPARVDTIIETMRKKRMIVGNSIKAWDKRQPKREREDNSGERVKAFRDRQKQQRNDGVTPCNAQRRGEENRLEEKKEEHPLTPSDEFELQPPKEPNAETSPDHPRVVRPAVPSSALSSEAAGWFAQWWAIYWLHKARAGAETAFRKRVRTEPRFQRVMAATREQSPEMLSREPSKRPYGATWLNGERWEDEPSAPVNGSGKPPGHKNSFMESVEKSMAENLALKGTPW